jgi:hypothetical protein
VVLSANETGKAFSGSLLAYSVQQLGFFYRSGSAATSAGLSYPRPVPMTFDTQTRITRAGWHFVWPAVLLAVVAFLSKRQHGQGTP